MESLKNDRKSFVMMVLSLLIVGTIGLFRRLIPLPSALLAFFRGLIGAAMLGLLLLLRRRPLPPVPRRVVAGLALNGVFLGLNWILLFDAFTCTTIARATLCYYLAPTIVLLLSPAVFHEALTPKKLSCAAAALLGMAAVAGVVPGTGLPIGELRGVALALGAACFYALVVILNKKLGGVDPWRRTVLQLSAAALVLLPYLLLTGSFSALTPEPRQLLLLLTVGVVHTGVVYALYFGSMEGLRAQTISTLSYIDPVTSLFVSFFILREPLSPSALAGAALILGSAFVSEYEPRTTAQ